MLGMFLYGGAMGLLLGIVAGMCLTVHFKMRW